MFPGNPLLRLAGLPAPPEEVPPEYVRATTPSAMGPIAAAQGRAAEAGAAAPHKGIGHAVGGFFGSLLGFKHAENIDRMNKSFDIFKTLVGVALQPGSPPELMGAALEFAKKANLDPESIKQTENFGKMKADAEAKYEEYRKKIEALKRTQQPALGQTPPQPMPQAALNPPGQAPPIQTMPQIGPPQPPGAPAAAAPAPALNPLQFSRQFGGLPTPPFSGGGVQAGPPPNPPNPPVGRAQSAQGRDAGFGGPTTAGMDIPEVPDPSMRGNLANYGAPGEGRRLAAIAAPGERFKTEEAVRQADLIAQQAQERQLAMGKFITQLINSDEFQNKTLQEQEMILRGYNVQGAISNIPRLVSIPGRPVRVKELPENAVDVNGKPVDRSSPGWAKQMFDPVTKKVVGFPATPTLTSRQLMLNVGGRPQPVVVYAYPDGELAKVVDAVNGNLLTDKALLENVRQHVTKVESTDSEGNAVTVLEPIIDRSWRGIPGAMTPPPGGAAQTSEGGISGVGAVSGQRVFPKPLTSSTRSAAEFAREVKAEIPDIIGLIDKLEENGKLGIAASRWNEFMAGKVGAGDPDFTTLRTAVELMDSGTARIHARSGSMGMLNHFHDMTNYGIMDGPTLKAAATEMQKWVNRYAAMGAGRKGAVDVGGGSKDKNALTPPPLVIDLGPGKQVVIK